MPHKVNYLRLLHLNHITATCVGRVPSGVLDRECVRAENCNLSGYVAVQLSHSLNFCECHKVSSFEGNAMFIRNSDNPRIFLKV